MGGLGAYLYFYKKDLLKIFGYKWVELSALIFFVFVISNNFHITSVIDHEIVTFFTLIIIYNQINNPKRLINLENSLFDYLGRISYGLYVWNPLVIYLISFLIGYFPNENYLLKMFLIYSSVILILILVAHLSYYFFEKKFLKIKTKYVTVRSAASKNELEKRKELIEKTTSF